MLSTCKGARQIKTQRLIHNSSNLFAKQTNESATGKEAYLAAEAKLNESWKNIQSWKLSSGTPTPLIRWLNKIQDQENASLNAELMDKVRERYPEEAKKADDFINTLSPGNNTSLFWGYFLSVRISIILSYFNFFIGYLTEEMQREFPELSKKLNDLEVFDFLIQFVEPQEKDNEKYQNIRTFLSNEIERKEKLVCLLKFKDGVLFFCLRTFLSNNLLLLITLLY
jgi:hypothetical protein